MLERNSFSSLDGQLIKLNPEQKKAVTTTSGPILILAGAGSGKTRVLVSRIAFFVEKKKVDPGSILAVTFTNKAANEMKERVKLAIGANAFRGLTISTFHSLGVKILGEEIHRLGYSKKFTIYSQREQLSLVKTILNDLQSDSLDYKAEQYLANISFAKNKFLEEIPDGFVDDTVFNTVLKEVYKTYNETLKIYNAVDFDDLLFLPVKIFKLYQAVLEKYRERFKHIMVDEYQDTNKLQYIFIRLLSEKHRNICVVGDDDQSIYGFRGAEVENILNFEKDFTEAKVIKLEQNYRSTNTILKAANVLIKQNTRRKEKNLWSENGEGKPIDWIVTDSEDEEARIIAERIKSLVFYKKSMYKDILVLLRTNFHAKIFEEEFRAQSIPYRLIGGMQFFDRKEIKALLSYLKVFTNPEDDLNLLNIINFPARSIGRTSILKLKEYAKENKTSVWQVLKSEKHPEHLQAVFKKTSALTPLIEKYIEIFSNPPGLISAHQEVRNFLDESDFLTALVTESKDHKKGIRSRENVISFLNFIKNQEKRENGISIKGFLDKMSLLENLNKDKEDKDEDLVTIMTIHCSKGLEFNHVFMVGMEEEVFPHLRSLGDQKGIEEERRLCYVGITRAKQHLTMSMPKYRKKWGENTIRVKSRFIDELPSELLNEREGQFSSLTEVEVEKTASDLFKKIQDL